MVEVLNNVQRLRKKNKITQEEFAEAIGVTRQTVISLEKGNYAPSVLLALKISKFFNTPVNDIFYLK